MKNNPYWLNELLWFITYVLWDIEVWFKNRRAQIKKWIWIARGRPSLEADLRKKYERS